MQGSTAAPEANSSHAREATVAAEATPAFPATGLEGGAGFADRVASDAYGEEVINC